jgi:hypothetical protein
MGAPDAAEPVPRQAEEDRRSEAAEGRVSAREKPPCQQIPSWLKGRLGKHALAPLTGQDAVALSAFAHVIALWGRSDSNGRRLAVIAGRAIVLAMQPTTRDLAKASIPCVLDWSHEEQLWAAMFDHCDDEQADRVLRELADDDERALIAGLQAKGFRFQETGP